MSLTRAFPRRLLLAVAGALTLTNSVGALGGVLVFGAGSRPLQTEVMIWPLFAFPVFLTAVISTRLGAACLWLYLAWDWVFCRFAGRNMPFGRSDTRGGRLICVAAVLVLIAALIPGNRGRREDP